MGMELAGWALKKASCNNTRVFMLARELTSYHSILYFKEIYIMEILK
jgi:hypothetical protein